MTMENNPNKRLNQDDREREKRANATNGMYFAGFIIVLAIIIIAYLYNGSTVVTAQTTQMTPAVTTPAVTTPATVNPAVTTTSPANTTNTANTPSNGNSTPNTMTNGNATPSTTTNDNSTTHSNDNTTSNSTGKTP